MPSLSVVKTPGHPKQNAVASPTDIHVITASHTEAALILSHVTPHARYIADCPIKLNWPDPATEGGEHRSTDRTHCRHCSHKTRHTRTPELHQTCWCAVITTAHTAAVTFTLRHRRTIHCQARSRQMDFHTSRSSQNAFPGPSGTLMQHPPTHWQAHRSNDTTTTYPCRYE